MQLTKSAALAALAALPATIAQTYTSCNPTTNSTCPEDAGLDSWTFSSDFTSSSGNTSWSAETGTTITYGSNGAEFTINQEGQAPTIYSDFYVFFGKIEVVMKAAPGTGIVSSIVLESDDLDEIDWEFLGGDTTQAETNYFGKGNTTTYDRAIYYTVSTPQTTFHTYTVDWTSESIIWYIDGTAVRTLLYADANGGDNFPQTPMRLKMGNWAGGASTESAGTIAWAGGETDFSDAPFTMYVKSVSITNYNPGQEYEYTNESGSYSSIKVINGTSSSSLASTKSSSVSSSASSAKSTSTSAKSSTSTKATVSVANGVVSTNSTITTSTSGKAAATASTTSTLKSTTKSSSSSKSTSTSSSTSSSSVAEQTTNGVAANSVGLTLLSLSSIALGFWML